MMIGLIPIYERDSFEVKIEIYYQIMTVIPKSMFKHFYLCIVVWLETILEKAVVNDVLIMYMDGNVQ